MLLDLRDIIDTQGGRVSFDFEPDMTEALTGSIDRIAKKARAVGNVTNNAGLLTLTCTVDVTFICICARCIKEFEKHIETRIVADITKSGEGENPDGYCLQGEAIDAAEVIITEFILNTDDVLLCSDDCAGLCQGCGADLNSDICKCEREIDPRLAALKDYVID